MLWTIKTLEKKNVRTLSEWCMPDEGVAAGKTFYIEEWWRWGEWTVRTDKEPRQADDCYEEPIDMDEFDVDDQNLDDGVALDFQFGSDWTEEEKAYVEQLWDEDSYTSFEEAGIYQNDCYTQAYGPVEVVCIDDTPEPEPKEGGTWPF